MRNVFFTCLFLMLSLSSFGQSTKFFNLEAQAITLINSNKWDDLLMLAPEMISEEPQKGEGYYYTAVAFYHLKSFKEAEEYVNLALGFENPEALKQKIDELKQSIAFGKTIKTSADKLKNQKNASGNDLKKLWELDKKNLEFALNAIEALIREGDYESAIQILDDPSIQSEDGAIKLKERLANTPKMRNEYGYSNALKNGVSKFKAGKFEESIIDFKTAVKFKPNDPTALDYIRNAKEEIAWNKAVNSTYINETEAYIEAYPNGKYATDANRIIKKSYGSIAYKAYIESDETTLNNYYTKYLERYPGDEEIEPIRNLLSSFYLTKADANYKARYYYEANTYYEKYLGFFPEVKNIDYAKKQLNRCERKMKQNDATILAYNFDKESSMGLHVSNVWLNSVGGYFNFKMNAPIFIGMTTLYTIDNANNTTSPWAISRTGTNKYANVSVSGGITFKVLYPFWMYVGGGFSYLTRFDQIDEFTSSGNLHETVYMRNTDQTSFRLFPETGILFKPGKVFAFKYGIMYRQGLLHQFGIGFQF